MKREGKKIHQKSKGDTESEIQLYKNYIIQRNANCIHNDI